MSPISLITNQKKKKNKEINEYTDDIQYTQTLLKYKVQPMHGAQFLANIKKNTNNLTNVHI